jgi:hypothetical protein
LQHPENTEAQELVEWIAAVLRDYRALIAPILAIVLLSAGMVSAWGGCSADERTVLENASTVLTERDAERQRAAAAALHADIERALQALEDAAAAGLDDARAIIESVAESAEARRRRLGG